MSMTDPIADFLTRIRNGQRAGKPEVALPSSRIKLALAKVLKDEGYIDDFVVAGNDGKPILTVRLKYYQGRPAIDRLERVSPPGARRHQGKDWVDVVGRPGARVYKGRWGWPRNRGGMGVAIISTSSGVMSARDARAGGHG